MTKSINNTHNITKQDKKSRVKYSLNTEVLYYTSKIIFPESNINVSYNTNLDISDKKILVLSLVKNCSKSLKYIYNFINNLNQKFSDVKFSFFSNNNTDNTLIMLDDLQVHLGGSNIQIIKYVLDEIDNSNRIEKLALYRNLNLQNAINYFGSNFDYLIVFDSDLVDDIPVDAIVDSLKINNINWSCISGNHCYENSSYYYDELALRFLGENIDIQEKFKNFKQFYGDSHHWIENLYIINDWIRVKSAFGGISIYKMPEIIELLNDDTNKNIYSVSNLPEFTAEHIGLNLKLKNAILINPNIKYTNSVNIEGTMYSQPIAFIPRDAGFFSVFNFYVGCLSLGIRAYPYFNKKALLSMNNKNEHFCYWTNNENCWFDYFEPVKFFDNDLTHENDTYKSFIRHNGEMAPVEFRIPHETKALIQNKEKFINWRHQIHKFYKQHIKYNNDITTNVEKFWTSNINKSYVIGVHYRHPSHFVESGKVYLQQYFEKIDEILHNNPDAQIFLATDSNFGIYSFVERYKDKVIFISDIERLTMPEFLEWCFSLADGVADDVGFINGKGFELHHKRVNETDNKKMTVDLLREVLCLSKCNSLVHTTSNVALAISYMNPDLDLISL